MKSQKSKRSIHGEKEVMANFIYQFTDHYSREDLKLMGYDALRKSVKEIVTINESFKNA